ncbi:TrkH family potassium uptake protein [Lutimaribacter sp. EGI FJ00015]|uniref:TrkH family potassium uptake protein n=1 Tax=Lutimaribacter degradans TaxID=2945989 RepID=A0ACC5ZQZ1_9RHOB|nr:TrkH family potassium uptake protein [Lutimaribacter sp. EGI FJ00013]MCM2560738.1 TrkH family potassium uptake protein [Lutimaribacter sp. EGI FJ00013]MCO0612316.1 TrkH family potassium uptake protein [Lutimaribacter sp. EGI FJ00015]MCO0634563.1 TrkH family potassium uptake protein [Lutimaribacter sp. EGI FJ00014]
MLDPRPVGYVIGLLVAVLGLLMVPPMLVDLAEGREHWPVFFESAVLTFLTGSLVALACQNSRGREITIRQGFLLTVGTWVALPAFAAIPFMMGATQARFVDALFEAMSGMTTTGATVFAGLDDLPKGLLLWRGILQWLGGLGIVIVAMLFLPIMRVGGMQFFRSESFDTLGKVMPRAIDISKALLATYIVLTLACVLTYIVLGMDPFVATVHALTSVSTGGFSTSDASFSGFSAPLQYACILFMFLASVPFVRLMLIGSGKFRPLLFDFQVQAYALAIAAAIFLIFAMRVIMGDPLDEDMFRHVAFNVVSIFSGTGYGDGDVTLWGAAPLVVLLAVGAIGGCTGSTGCSIKVFRYLILFKALAAQLRLIGSPNRIVSPRLAGRPIEQDVIESVMLMFTMFILTLGLMSVALALTGLPFMEATTGAWTAIFNVGPAFGELVGDSGALSAFPDSAKYIMIFGMLLGRLELVVVYVLFTSTFWRG